MKHFFKNAELSFKFESFSEDFQARIHNLRVIKNILLLQSLFHSRHKANPSIAGIRISEMIRSGGSCRAMSSASTPLEAAETS